jgi:hypothetical protein
LLGVGRAAAGVAACNVAKWGYTSAALPGFVSLEKLPIAQESRCEQAEAVPTRSRSVTRRVHSRELTPHRSLFHSCYNCRHVGTVVGTTVGSAIDATEGCDVGRIISMLVGNDAGTAGGIVNGSEAGMSFGMPVGNKVETAIGIVPGIRPLRPPGKGGDQLASASGLVALSAMLTANPK